MVPVYGAATFIIVTATWVLFRAESLPQAVTYYGDLFTLAESSMATASWLALAALGLMLAWHAAIRQREIESMYARLAWPLRGVLLGVLLAAVLLSPGENRAFIYFQF
jgi:D-alanyl-lipoteichoic acid acyltransferase DltB (MBOAT superfamily)